MPKRIAIPGRCVTRDAITSVAPGTVVHYQARMKSASIASPVPVEMPEVPEFHARVKFTQACIQTDFDKSYFMQLSDGPPDAVTIDFIDERFPLLRRSEQIVTMSDALAMEQDKNIFADANHVWRPTAFHYEPRFYENRRNRLTEFLSQM